MQQQKAIQYSENEIRDYLINYEDKKYLTQFAVNKLDYNGENGVNDEDIANWIAQHVTSSRGGDPEQYGQYQTLENTLKGMILNGEQQIAFNDWFPLSQKRSEKEDEYVNQLGDRDQWIDQARRFLNRNNINPDTFQQIQ
ncbi:hypothetical protein QTN25_006293 [Entamoeba marina]